MLGWNTNNQKLEHRISRLEIAMWLLTLIAISYADWFKGSSGIRGSQNPKSGGRLHKRARRNSRPHFIITSLFLRECIPFLMQDELEVVSYVSGPKIYCGRILDQLVRFKMAQRELCRARGDIVSSTAALVRLGDRGFQLNGTIHSHPGTGEGASVPSSKDLTLHWLLEQGGYQAVGIIMTRDGYVRFYTAYMPFTLKVIGKDIIKLGHNRYRLLLNH
jgi:hypothetical protein